MNSLPVFPRQARAFSPSPAPAPLTRASYNPSADGRVVRRIGASADLSALQRIVTTGTRPTLSIVTTLYRSAEFIKEFHRRMTAAAEAVAPSYEIVIVNDGSPDRSLDIALALAASDARLRVVDLSRNFGHHAAILAGLRESRGELVFLIDIDLEEQPEWLQEFWEDMRAGGADLVYGVQTQRVGSPFKRHTGALFYSLFNLFSETSIPHNVCTVRLMTRRYVESVCRFCEAHVFLAGLFAWAGYSQRQRYVTKVARPGRSSYTPLRLMRLFVTAITSFSSYPLTIVFFLGACLTAASAGYALWLLIQKLLYPGIVLSGFTSIMVSLWFIGGALLCSLGLIGMYIGRIFVETKGRPQYLIRRIHEAPDAAVRHE